MKTLTLTIEHAIKGCIYTTKLELKDNWQVWKGNTLIASHSIRTEALVEAAKHVLQGFTQPGFYTAYIDGLPYAQKEVLKETKNHKQ